MKLFSCIALTLALLLTSQAETIKLSADQSVSLTLPDTWQRAAPLPAPTGMEGLGTTVRYVTKDGSNDALLLTILITPDDRHRDPATLKTMAEQAATPLLPGSVEKKADLKELRFGSAWGYSFTITDANLVGQPPRKDDYKTLTSCLLHLGNRVLATATIFTDHPTTPAYAQAQRILQSLSLSTPANRL